MGDEAEIAGRTDRIARAMNGAAGGQFAEGFLLGAQAVVHGEDFRNDVIADDQHG